MKARDRKAAVMHSIKGFYRRVAAGKVEPRVGKSVRFREEPEVPYEHDEQRDLCRWLTGAGVSHFSVPNGSHLANGYRSMAWLKAEGLKDGIPDLILIDRAPVDGKPVAVELKRVGGKGGKVRKDRTLTDPCQAYWQKLMPLKGWHHIVGLGADDAVQQLRELGYGGREAGRR